MCGEKSSLGKKSVLASLGNKNVLNAVALNSVKTHGKDLEHVVVAETVAETVAPVSIKIETRIRRYYRHHTMVSVVATFFEREEPRVLAVRVTPHTNVVHATLRKHLGLLIDTSGSMSGERLDSVKKTIRLLLERKPTNYALTLMTFSHRSIVVVEAKTEAALLSDAVERLFAEGGTNLQAGILSLREVAVRNPFDAVLLLTDGQITSGEVRSISGLTSLLKSALPTLPPVHAIGYGADYNKELLSRIAELTHSQHMYADAAEMLPAVVGDVLEGLRSEVGSAAVLHFDSSAFACMEPHATGDSEFAIGTLIGEKEQWVLLRGTGSGTETGTETGTESGSGSGSGTETGSLSLTYRAAEGAAVTLPIPITTEIPRKEIAKQIARIRCATVFNAVYAAIEEGHLDIAHTECTALALELEASEAKDEDMVICLKAQVSELLEQLDPTTPRPMGAFGAPPQTALLSRLSSNTSALTTQRGFVSRMASGAAAAETHTFSSPRQRETGRNMTQSYSSEP